MRAILSALIGIILLTSTVNFGEARIYEISSASASADLNISAIVLDESSTGPYKRVHIAVWEPGKNPYNGDSSSFLVYKADDVPQTHLTIPESSKKEGTYYVAVIGGLGDTVHYTLEITGHEVLPQ